MKRQQKFETIFLFIWHFLSKRQIKWKIVSNFCGLWQCPNFTKMKLKELKTAKFNIPYRICKVNKKWLQARLGHRQRGFSYLLFSFLHLRPWFSLIVQIQTGHLEHEFWKLDVRQWRVFPLFFFANYNTDNENTEKKNKK